MIVVTTPTGNIGSQVLEKLVRSDEEICVVGRSPAKLSPQVRERVEVIEGSHGDRDVLDKAFATADTVFWLTPPDPRADSVESAYIDFTRPAADAMRNRGVERVVGVSALGRGTPWASKAGFITASLAVDDLIASSGVSYRALTMPSFMDNLLRQAEPIRKDGVFSLPISGDRKLPSVATRDIASAAAELLLDKFWIGVSSRPLLGPEDLSYNDMAAILSDLLGTPVRFERISDEAFKARLMGRGMSDAMAQGNLDMFIAKDHGLDSAERRTPESTTPTTFRDWAREALKPPVSTTIERG
jgi:uncharacterized protein YbjT (DUF2867 family)